MEIAFRGSRLAKLVLGLASRPTWVSLMYKYQMVADFIRRRGGGPNLRRTSWLAACISSTPRIWTS
jgi:hypothetical protein